MASIPCYEFGEEQLQNCDALFPREIEDDRWIFHHATSSVFETDIDSQGLVWKPSVCSKQDLETVAKVFTSMNWLGKGGGGMVVLGSFSLMGDFRGEESKPIYLREFSTRSLIYAKSDFAGGESARAVRHAMRDLKTYLENEDVRLEHYEEQRTSCIRLLKAGYLPDRVVRVNLDWLAKQIEELTPLWRRCETLKEQHTHGVVYAVRFDESDLPFCSLDDGMGLRCKRQLDAGRLVAKARILTDKVDSVGDGFDMFEKHMQRVEDPTGMLFALNKLQNTNDRPDDIPPSPNTRQDLIDPAAGRDEWPGLLEEYGTSEIIEQVRKEGHPSSIVKASAELLRA